ncbi:hypothetical protein PPACK8108_LOCUS4653 [Phakopsora pachyrhizi]|uniref:Citrate transporter-like domain-containing protein n=1 Tax=Phakopsora pachyrhizi TaxID=170000 RepID=A0AAV0ANQ0_PHAPC|nr:hypothetical protein PPACK8108_LOCUS4653 [Phakopsora pachyrhizi]
MVDSDHRSIDGFSIFGLVVFVAVMIPVLIPFKIPLGKRLTRLLRALLVWGRVLDNPSGSNSLSSITKPKLDGEEKDENEKKLPSSESFMKNNDKDCWKIPFDLSLSPPLGVLILLMTTTIDGNVIKHGILGEGDSKPYDVLVLFICLAYIAITLDSTGALKSLAVYVSNKSQGSGPQLYLTLYIFFFIFGVIFGNDPIILSGTAFLTYFLRDCGVVDPTAWIFMEFVAANVSSAVLVSSNPTNVLIAQAFDLNFLTGFTKYTVLPSFVTGIAGYLILYAMFKFISIPDPHPEMKDQGTPQNEKALLEKDQKAETPTECARAWSISRFLKRMDPGKIWKKVPRANYIPKQLIQTKLSPMSCLVDPQGACFHGILMIVTLLLLVGTSFLKNVSVWEITLPAGVLSLLRDLIYDLSAGRKSGKGRRLDGISKAETTAEGIGSDLNKSQCVPDQELDQPSTNEQNLNSNNQNGSTSNLSPENLQNAEKAEGATLDGSKVLKNSKDDREREGVVSKEGAEGLEQPAEKQRMTMESLMRAFEERFPVTTETLKKLPIPLLPFAISMFVLVSSLKSLGWVRIFAGWFASVCVTPVRSVYFVGFLTSFVLCPLVGTNIGATILLVNIVTDEKFIRSVRVIEDPKILKAVIYSIGLGSNLGAFSLTIQSSLAGLLWFEILKNKRVLISKKRFLMFNLLPIVILSTVCYSILLIEVLYMM